MGGLEEKTYTRGGCSRGGERERKETCSLLTIRDSLDPDMPKSD